MQKGDKVANVNVQNCILYAC